ncbi:MAG: alanine--glyoxylate aminotransferase family protein [Lachnospiraceae bacterium]|nr:alanine--glyoxylate aminotransferase family protein [Lachnospiraceae bacterium]
MLNFTVGPVMSCDEVTEVSSHSAPYFRTPEFSELMLENEALMLKYMKAPAGSRCVFLTTSGTGAMESIVMNVLSKEDRVLVVNGGSFGHRFVQLCELHELEHTSIDLAFGQALRCEDLSKYAGKGYTALLVNMHETSSGVLYDMPMIAGFCKENGIMLLVDAISAFIADELDMEALGAAAVITGSQKALAVFPGISVVALAPQALKRVEKNPERCMYLSLKDALKNGERGQTPFTPAVMTLLQINRRLRMIEENGGIEAESKKIAELARQFRSGISDLPLKNASQSCSNAVTALKVNSGAREIFRILKDEYKIWICPNGGDIADVVFRVGHIGNITKADIETLTAALHELHERGVY